MYAEYFMLKLGPGMQAAGQGLADRFAPLMRAARGFQGVTFFADYEAGDYGVFTRWASREDYEAFHGASMAQLEQALAGLAKEAPIMKLYDVYEPKA